VTTERLGTASQEAVDDINRLLPQLKPAWPPINVADLEEVLVASRAYVAVREGTIVGLALLVPHRHLGGLRLHVEDVVVDEQERRRGVARRLLVAAMADAPPETVSFDLRSHADRPGAHALYTGLGFVPRATTVFRRFA